MGGRKGFSEYSFRKKITAGLLDCHYFRFRMKVKYNTVIKPTQQILKSPYLSFIGNFLNDQRYTPMTNPKKVWEYS